MLTTVVSDSLNWLFPMMMWFSSGPQYHAFPTPYLQRPIHFSINANLEHQSNGINAEVLKVITGGREVTPVMKDRSLARLKPVNRLGVDVNAELSFVHFPMCKKQQQSKWGYYIGYKNRFVAHARISPDTYKLLFYGNSPFKGDTLHLKDERVRYMAYQQLSVGFVHNIVSKKWTGNVGLALSYINGSNFGDIRIKNGSFFTSSDAFTIDVGAQFGYFANDATKNRYHYPNASGMSADLFLNLQDPTRKNSISLKLQDFGFMRANNFSQGLKLDTNITFEGIAINSPYDINGDFINNLGDSATRIINSGKYKDGKYIMLPSQLQIAYNRELIPFKLYGSLIYTQRFFSNAMPMGTVQVWGYPDPQIMIGGSVSYGGWGSYSIGVDLGFDLTRGWVLSLGTKQIQGIIAERKSSGFGGYAGIYKSFSGVKNKKGAKNEK